MASLPRVKIRRELANRSKFRYRWFWKSCPWEVFHPAKSGPRTKGPSLKKKPAVYEFALSLPRRERRVKVYVGQTKNAMERMAAYETDGSHLRDFLSLALSRNYVLWRRIHYLRSEKSAQERELWLLRMYDYAWNTVQNGPPRTLIIKPNHLLCCIPAGYHIRSEPTARRVAGQPRPSLLALPHYLQPATAQYDTAPGAPNPVPDTIGRASGLPYVRQSVRAA